MGQIGKGVVENPPAVADSLKPYRSRVKQWNTSIIYHVYIVILNISKRNRIKNEYSIKQFLFQNYQSQFDRSQ